MIKLAISDLDGTFLNSQGTFDSEYFEKVLNEMEKNDIVFAACTGKQCERVEELFKNFVDRIWILGDSATRIKHQGTFAFESLLSNKLGVSIIKTLEKVSSEHVIIGCTPTAAFIKDNISEENEAIVRGSYQVVKTVADITEMTEDFVKITVYDPKKNCFETVKSLQEYEEDAYIIASEASWIDISNAGIHKGSTVKELQALLGVKKEETIGFGDGYNDLELFDEVGISFAMKNAFPEVQDKADFIIKENNEHGVLVAIEKIMQAQNN